MSARALAPAVTLASGALFGAGLVLSGMTQPQRVIGFLDVGGAWDPSLLFVMLGAVGVHLFAYRWIRGRKKSLFGARFDVPNRRGIDAKLLLGSALFGVGWGLGGYCPGPGIVSLAGGGSPAVTFVSAMVFGMLLTSKVQALVQNRHCSTSLRSEKREV